MHKKIYGIISRRRANFTRSIRVGLIYSLLPGRTKLARFREGLMHAVLIR
jgi:hypothetical protein